MRLFLAICYVQLDHEKQLRLHTENEPGQFVAVVLRSWRGMTPTRFSFRCSTCCNRRVLALSRCRMMSLSPKPKSLNLKPQSPKALEPQASKLLPPRGPIRQKPQTTQPLHSESLTTLLPSIPLRASEAYAWYLAACVQCFSVSQESPLNYTGALIL